MSKALAECSHSVFRIQDRLDWQAGRSGSLLPTGMDELDRMLGGGVPRGSLVEIVGTVSSGRTGALLGLLAEATSRGELAAYIDACDSLDPLGAQASGIDLQRLLWVRCASESPASSVTRAVKAADAAIKAGGFGVVALDLEAPQPSGRRSLPRAPAHCWFRLQRAVKDTPAVLVALQPSSSASSAASLVLSFQRKESDWGLEAEAGKRPRLLRGIEGEIEVMRGGSPGCAGFRSLCWDQPAMGRGA